MSSEISTGVGLGLYQWQKHNKTHNALLNFYPQLMELKSDFPPDGGLHSQLVDIQATMGNPVDPKV